MTATESVSTGDADSATTATDEEPPESTDSASEAVSWGPPELTRLRSFALGGLAGTIVATIVVAMTRLPELVSGEGLSVDALVLFRLLLVGGALSVVSWKLVSEKLSEADRRSIREQLPEVEPGWSSIAPSWTGCGVLLFGAAGWGLAHSGTAVYVLLMTALWLSLVSTEWHISWTVDPEAGVIETDRPERTSRRSTEWAVDLRRFDLLGRSLFVFSNRGKRWYEGRHLLSVPSDRVAEVDPLLRRMVDRNDPPPRTDREERLIIGGVGASMLAVGPLLYLLSGEGAVLLLIAGPSALVAHFALLHAVRA